MSKIMIWVGQFDSEADFEKYMDQSAFRQWWKDYDEDNKELRCQFCKELGVMSYDEDFLIMKMIQCIYLYGLSNLSHVPNLCNLPNLRRIGICNMKRLEQMPTLNRELESLDVEKNVPMLGVDSFRDVTPINLPNLKWIRINLGNDVKSNMILDRFKNICETTRW